MNEHDDTYNDRISRRDSARAILLCGFGMWAALVGALLTAVLTHKHL